MKQVVMFNFLPDIDFFPLPVVKRIVFCRQLIDALKKKEVVTFDQVVKWAKIPVRYKSLFELCVIIEPKTGGIANYSMWVDKVPKDHRLIIRSDGELTFLPEEHILT